MLLKGLGLSGSFSPADLSGLVGWFDPNQGMFQEIASPVTPSAVGDPVGTWVPRIGSNANARSNSVRGTRATLNGFNRLRLDGVDDFLEVSDNTWMSSFTGVDAPFTVCEWFQLTIGGIAENIWSFASAVSTQPFIFIQLFTQYTKRRRTDGNADNNQAAGTVDGSSHSSILTYNSTVFSHYLDGVEIGTPLTMTSGTCAVTRFGIGALPRGLPGNYVDGYIGNVCIFTRALNATEIAQMDTFLRSN